MLERYRYDIVGFARECLGIELHEGQKRFLRRAVKFDADGRLVKKYINLTASNRWGKTVCLAVIHLYFAVYKHGLYVEGADWLSYPYGIINLCPLVDLANVLRDMVDQILRSEAKEQINNPRGRGYCKISPLFETNEKGSYLVTFGDYKGFRTKLTAVSMEYRTTDDNAKAVQGTPKFLITFDEAGRQGNFLNLMGAHVNPRTLDTGGVIFTATTPDVDTGTDYEEWWKKGDPDNFFADPLFYSARGVIRDNPYVTEEQIQKLIAGTPEYLLPQVLYGEFIQGSEAFFAKSGIDKSFVSELQAEHKREHGHFYIIGADLAVAKAGDRSVFVVWDATKKPYRVLEVIEPKRGTSHPVLIQQMKELLEYYHSEWPDPESPNVIRKSEALLVYDATGLGGKMFKTELANLVPRPRGYDFGGLSKKKLEILTTLRLILDKGQIQIPGTLLAMKQELKDYKRTDAKLDTDSVMAMALAAYMAERSIAPDEMEEFEDIY